MLQTNCCKNPYIISIGTRYAQCRAGGFFNNQGKNEQVNSGDLFYLATCGKPQIIRVGHPENKGDRNPIQQIPFKTFKLLRISLDLSNRGTRKLISTLNKATGRELSSQK